MVAGTSATGTVAAQEDALLLEHLWRAMAEGPDEGAGPDGRAPPSPRAGPATEAPAEASLPGTPAAPPASEPPSPSETAARHLTSSQLRQRLQEANVEFTSETSHDELASRVVALERLDMLAHPVAALAPAPAVAAQQGTATGEAGAARWRIPLRTFSDFMVASDERREAVAAGRAAALPECTLATLRQRQLASRGIRHLKESVVAEVEQVAKEGAQSCTFTPRLVTPHRPSGKQRKVFAALYAVASDWRGEAERKRLELAEAAMADCTFAPDLTASARTLHSRPFELQ